MRHSEFSVAESLGLRDIISLLLYLGKTCSDYNLPTPAPLTETIGAYAVKEDYIHATLLISTLNDAGNDIAAIIVLKAKR